MFTGFHPLDLLAIFIVALLIFGPKRLPEMGKAIGATFKEFKKSVNDLQAPPAASPAALPPTATTIPQIHESTE